ncbi:hypothetical protein SDC9_191947 [bioreactor metagenome]|uniref:Uncharacterized protein n=1 Tax=bioreactor metagenome TaxID=1076179 RepID=A0A645I0V8_9ZZZZ
MTKHLNTDQLPGRPFDLLVDYIPVNRDNLIHIQFPRQHHYVGELGVELQRFRIGNIQLCRQMHLHPDTAGVHQDRHIGGDH